MRKSSIALLASTLVPMLLALAPPSRAAAAPDVLALDVGGNRSLHVSLENGQLSVKEVGGLGPSQSL